jgi:hypothetical protein
MIFNDVGDEDIGENVTDVDFEYIPSFEGTCTCDHEMDQHSWGDCGVTLPDGTECHCEAGWFE